VTVVGPGSSRELADLGRGSRLEDRPAWAATEALAADLGASPDDVETLEWSALVYASVEALARHGARLVAVAQAGLADEAEPGRGRLGALDWKQVTAVFADDPAAAPVVAVLGPAIAGLDVDAAWEHPGLAQFASETGLLWYDASELARGLVWAVTTQGNELVEL
jgi:hypothetical protein